MLKNRLAIYIPSKIGQEEISVERREFFLKKVLADLSRTYGGATAIDGVGAWLSEVDGLVMERVTICYTFTDSNDFQPIYRLAAELAAEMRQEAVAVEVNGGMDFVAAAAVHVA